MDGIWMSFSQFQEQKWGFRSMHGVIDAVANGGGKQDGQRRTIDGGRRRGRIGRGGKSAHAKGLNSAIAPGNR